MTSKNKISMAFVVWHITHSSVMACAAQWYFVSPKNELGTEPGYAMIFAGILPSISLLILSFSYPQAAYKGAMYYGMFIMAASLIIATIAYGFLWIIVGLPMFAFIVESIVIYLSGIINKSEN